MRCSRFAVGSDSVGAPPNGMHSAWDRNTLQLSPSPIPARLFREALVSEPTIKARRLTYVRSEAPDLVEAEIFLPEFGLQIATRTDDAIYYRGNVADSWCYVLTKGDGGFTTIAFEVDSVEDLEKMNSHDGRRPARGVGRGGRPRRVQPRVRGVARVLRGFRGPGCARAPATRALQEGLRRGDDAREALRAGGAARRGASGGAVAYLGLRTTCSSFFLGSVAWAP